MTPRTGTFEFVREADGEVLGAGEDSVTEDGLVRVYRLKVRNEYGLMESLWALRPGRYILDVRYGSVTDETTNEAKT